MRSPGRVFLVVLAMSGPSILGASARAGGMAETRPPCRAKVFGFREALSSERRFDDRNPLLRQPSQSWKVLGPGALQALIRHNEEKKSIVVIADTATGTTRPIPGLLVSGPVRWSPDGKRLAIVSWKSRDRAWVPVVFDLERDSVTGPACELMGTRLKWSPDGKWLAVDGRVPEKPISLLWIMDTRSGRCVVLDTMAVYATYDFGWSPDSRSLAVTRPSRLGEDEGVVAADLWLFNVDRTRCRLRATPHAVERNPRWLDQRRIILREEPDGLSTPVREVVVMLTRE